MDMIPDEDKEFLRNRFSQELENPVMIIAYTKKVEGLEQPGLECEFCRETEQLLNELAQLSDKIKIESRQYSPGDQLVQDLQIDKIPAIIVQTDGMKGVRYFGIPGGFEFSSLIEDVIDVSRNATDLSPKVKDRIKEIDQDVHIQVFVTPTCPFCPSAVRVAHKMAIENPVYIKSDAIEAAEFPHLVSRYDIAAVPTVIINEKVQFQGALAEEAFAEQVDSALAA